MSALQGDIAASRCTSPTLSTWPRFSAGSSTSPLTPTQLPTIHNGYVRPRPAWHCCCVQRRNSKPNVSIRLFCLHWHLRLLYVLTAGRLYVRNLPDTLQKEDLKRNLYMLFATYGVILDIVALKTMKMRGQAHVVFRDVDSSTQAMRALQAFTFFGKDMVRPSSMPNMIQMRMLTSTANCIREDKVRHHCEAGRNLQDA